MDTQMANTIINVVVAKQTTSGIINTVEPVTLKNIPTIDSGAKYIKDLNDVILTSPVNNDVLAYSNGFWINSNTAGGTTAYVNAIAQANIYANNAYTNAIAYVTNNSFVNTSQLSSNLSNYAALAGAAFTGNVNISASANVSTDLNVGRNFYVNNNSIIYGALTLGNNNVVTSDAPILNASQTWNAGANTVTALKLNVTDTSSNASSMLMDLQVGGVSQFKIGKTGTIVGAGGSIVNDSSLGGQVRINGTGYASLVAPNIFLGGGSYNGGAIAGIFNSGNTAIVVSTASYLGWTSDASLVLPAYADTKLYRDAAATLAQRNSTNAQTKRIYGTYTDASNYERLSLSANSTASYIQTENAGTGTARDLYLGANNVTAMVVAANGNIGIANTAPVTKLYIGSQGEGIRISPSNSSHRLRLYSGEGGNYINADYDGNQTFNIRFDPPARSGTTGGLKFEYGTRGNTITDATYPATFQISPRGLLSSNPAMYFDSAGKIGLGNTVPAHTLSVNGDMFVNTSIAVGNTTVNTVISSTTISLINIALVGF